ncbi:MAG: hypothetical protein CMM32_03785 [Rhodospirillaceae bacterium]|nr:hypothetical protein [Rhodospirillaceae bacterium]
MDGMVGKENYVFWWKENIRWGDQDAMGHVNNVQFARYIEASRIPFLRTLLVGGNGKSADFILAHLEVDYLLEMHFPGHVLIGTNVEEIGNTSVTLSHGLFKDNHQTGRGKSIVVHINSKDRRPKSISQDLRDELLQLKGQDN